MSKEAIVDAAIEWAKAARGYPLVPGAPADRLLKVVDEHLSETIFFLGRPVKVGDPIDRNMFEWMKMETRKVFR